MDKTSIQVLLIEDNPADGLALSEVLSMDALSAFAVSSCDSLETALALLQTRSSDAIVLDLSLAGGQGLAVVQQLHCTYPDMPQIVLAGGVDDAVSPASPPGWRTGLSRQGRGRLGCPRPRHPLRR
jgi:response regulator RpfG family c-di-GMP phosphodiesterase